MRRRHYRITAKKPDLLASIIVLTVIIVMMIVFIILLPTLLNLAIDFSGQLTRIMP